jgi:hypothetical protein
MIFNTYYLLLWVLELSKPELARLLRNNGSEPERRETSWSKGPQYGVSGVEWVWLLYHKFMAKIMLILL